MENKLTLKDGIEIAYVKKQPKEVKGVVMIIHGFAEHMGRYSEFKEFLHEKNYAVYSMDHIGHGKSGQYKGHVDDFHDMVESTDKLVSIAKSENEDLPIFMFGHSMGGLITLAYGLKYPDKLNGQIFSAPAIGSPIGRGLEMLLKLLAKICPKKYINNNLSGEICRDSQVVREYVEDPLVLKAATVKFYHEVFIKGIQYVQDNIKNYSCPCLIMHGTKDSIIDYKHSLSFYENNMSSDKTKKIFPGLYHELLNEPEKDEVKSEILDWLESRV
ncbi:lysophospholipase [Proteinivorax hydrogeniformans]|uniref:Monoacylglycerol lipase n=1 Tax=Proteinivorax hydrogeniformans TaxID=1826727 RepID=A0AAU8HVZ0_9FIRM